jgi:hypothetical protein
MPMEDGATYWVAYADGEMAAGIFPTNRPDFEGVPEGWMPIWRWMMSMRG